MEVFHDPLNPRPADKPVWVAGRNPRDEPDAGLTGCVPVVWGIADEEGFIGRGAGLVEDLPDALGLRPRRAVDPDEIPCEVPAAGDLLHLALRGRGDDVERKLPGAVPEEGLCADDVRNGEHGVEDQAGVFACKAFFLLRGEGFVEDVFVDIAELVVAGHAAVLDVEGDDLVEVLGCEGEGFFECSGL